MGDCSFSWATRILLKTDKDTFLNTVYSFEKENQERKRPTQPVGRMSVVVLFGMEEKKNIQGGWEFF